MTRLSQILLFSAALGAASPALADRDHDRAREALARGEILSLSVLLPEIEARYDARMLEVELETDDGRLVYEFELITSAGRIIEAEVDAATGAILEDEQEDDD